MTEHATVDAPVTGVEHWTAKPTADGPVRLFLWEKFVGSPPGRAVLLVHGSSMASTPSFDLQVPGHGDEYSAMDYFANMGYDFWCFDCEGYGRSDKTRDTDFFVSDGADDRPRRRVHTQPARRHVKLLVYGLSSGALRAAMMAERHPELVKRLVLDAFVWTGEGSPTLEARRKNLPNLTKTKRRPIDLDFVRSIFTRDHPGGRRRGHRSLRQRHRQARHHP